MKLFSKLFGKKDLDPAKVEEKPVKVEIIPPKRYYGGRIHKKRVYMRTY